MENTIDNLIGVLTRTVLELERFRLESPEQEYQRHCRAMDAHDAYLARAAVKADGMDSMPSHGGNYKNNLEKGVDAGCGLVGGE